MMKNLLRMFGFAHAEPAVDSDWNQPQVQTMADSATCREAARKRALLHQKRRFISADTCALRAAVGNRQADYLYSRFAAQLGWSSLADAQRFYNQNKNTPDAWGV